MWPANVCGFLRLRILSWPLGLVHYARKEWYTHDASKIKVMTNNKSMSNLLIFDIIILKTFPCKLMHWKPVLLLLKALNKNDIGFITLSELFPFLICRRLVEVRLTIFGDDQFRMTSRHQQSVNNVTTVQCQKSNKHKLRQNFSHRTIKSLFSHNIKNYGDLGLRYHLTAPVNARNTGPRSDSCSVYRGRPKLSCAPHITGKKPTTTLANGIDSKRQPISTLAQRNTSPYQLPGHVLLYFCCLSLKITHGIAFSTKTSDIGESCR